MSELEDKLGAILSNPQAMSQIMSLAQSLGAPAQPAVPPPALSEQPAPAESSVPPAPSPLNALLGGEGLDPRLLHMASRVLSECSERDDGRTALLEALRPFVRPQRYAKLDKAIRIARLSRLIRVALDALKGGEAPHV